MNGSKNENSHFNGRENAHIRAMIANGKKKIEAVVTLIKNARDEEERKKLKREIDKIEREFQAEYRKFVNSVFERVSCLASVFIFL